MQHKRSIPVYYLFQYIIYLLLFIIYVIFVDVTLGFNIFSLEYFNILLRWHLFMK